jgi:uroporphyrinogen-III decarboxylase
MNHKQRTLSTLLFSTPDKIPFNPGEPRESTLKVWHQQGLPQGVNWFEYLIETLNIDLDIKNTKEAEFGVDFFLRPQFEEKVLDHLNGHYIVQDWKGNVCEIADNFDPTYLRSPKDFVTRRWIKCPVESKEDWEEIKSRYNPDDSGRFPERFEEQIDQLNMGQTLTTVSVAGPFWQLREWCGFERLCMLMIEDPNFVAEMVSFWTNFVTNILEKILQKTKFDRFYMSEDMAYKTKSMISPKMVREFCLPSWKSWSKRVKNAGVPIVDMDSDGYVGELIPLWIEAGINVCDPMEVAAGNDINEFRKTHGQKIAFTGGIDKRAMAKGGDVLKTELNRIGPVLKTGGFIPSCDHGVPSDVSWPNFLEYSRQLATMTGWL